MKLLAIYPACSDNEISKDPFQIPYNLYKLYGINAGFACWKVTEEVVKNNINGLKIKRLFKYTSNEEITILLYVLLNARRIDWLNLYFLNKSRLIISKIYKTINPKGHVYVKMDAGVALLDKHQHFKKFDRTMLQHIDIISCETRTMSEFFSHLLKRRIVYIPNGFSGDGGSINTNKKKIFLTVGRLGTIAKNTECLLEAFAQSASYHDWELRLIGTVIEDDSFSRKFTNVIKDFYDMYPNLKSRVTFCGPIKDRELLKKQYEEARVFLLPSKWEGSPIVIPEALSCGLRILASNEVLIAKDIEKEGYAKTLPYWSSSAWANAIVEETRRNWDEVNYQEISDYAYREYSWKSSCEKLFNEMSLIERGDNV